MTNRGGIAIFLHINQILLSVLTIVGLHMSGQLWDYEISNNDDKTYWTGMVWAGVVGLLGIASCVTLIASSFTELPKKIVRFEFLKNSI